MTVAKTALESAVAEFERGHIVVDGPKMAYFGDDANRYVYVTLCSGGEKGVGTLLPALFATEEAAIAAWLTAAKTYATGRGRYVYWRTRPTIETLEVGGVNTSDMYYSVYSRLVVADAEWPRIGPAQRRAFVDDFNLYVTRGDRGFMVTYEEQLDNMTSAIVAAGLFHLGAT